MPAPTIRVALRILVTVLALSGLSVFPAVAQTGPDPAAADTVETGTQGSPNPLQRNREYLTGEDLLDEAFPNSLPIPGSNTRLRIGGYAKLDLVQDLDFVGDRYEFELATIPVEGSDQAGLGGLTTIHAKESRINFDIRSVATNEARGWEFPLQVFVEIDFFDDRDAFRLQPRLRHAYGVIGRFIVGRTWTTTTDLAALTGTVDFSGGDALYGGRVGLIRFEDRLGESFKWAIGVEEPAVSITGLPGVDGESRASLPNFAGKLRWNASNGSHVAVGADVFRLEWQGGDDGLSDSQVGYGLSLSGRYILGDASKPNAFSGAATIGSGSAHRVVALSFDGGNDAVMTADGLDATSHWQAYGGYSHYWTESLNSSVSAAWAELDNSRFQPGSAIHKAGSVHANLIWYPYRLVSTGLEVMWGPRENNDGASGSAWRLQYMTKFMFN